MNIKKFKNQKFTTGFTLIELMVSVALFAIIVGVIGSIFFTSLQSQRKAISFQGIFDQTSYLMEYMSRSLRMAKTDSAGICIAAGANYQKTHSGRGIKFVNSQNICQEFYLDTITNRLKEAKGGAQEQYLTSENSRVTAFNIAVSDEADLQPKVTFLVAIERKGLKAELVSPMEFQTTLSQRKLNIQ